MAERRAAQRLLETLTAFGVEYVFGIPGAKIDAVFDSLNDVGPRLIICRHEQNAAFMAAAVGRLTGTPGAVLVTSGPGTSNLATGLLTATTEQYPVIAICGSVARADRLKRTHQTMDAVAALEPLTKLAVEVDDADDVCEAVANALRAAVTVPRGAAAVVLPMDVAESPAAAGPAVVGRPGLLAAAPADDVAEAARLVHAATLPVVLAGMRASEPAACAALRQLLQHTELPVVETFQAAGVVGRDHESHFVGRVGLFRNQPGDVLLDRADVVLAVGYDPVEYDPRLWNPRGGRRTIVHVDELPAELDAHYLPALELRGDVAATVTALARRLEGHQLDSSATAVVAAQREALRSTDVPAGTRESAADGVDPVALVLAMREMLDDDATVACDVGSHYIYLARHFRTYRPRSLLFSDGQQTLGVALPWAMAAALIDPASHVVSVSGDGGFLFSATKLETATRLGLRLTHVVWRDGSYDMVKFQELLKYGRSSGVELGDYDIAHFAAAFGATGQRVHTLADFREAFRASLDAPGVTIIDVPVDYRRNTELGAQLHDGVLE